MTEHCVCGRNKLPEEGDRNSLTNSPVRAEIMQRLGTIRAYRLAAASKSPPDLVTIASLDREAADLRERLTRLAYD